MLENDREKYEKFFKNFGMQLKFGVYNDFGMHKDTLKDLIMFYSSKDEKLTTLKEYVSRMKKDQKDIYYVCGDSISKINTLPQVEAVKEKDYEILYLTEYVDEFALQILMEYDSKKFVNISSDDFNLDSEEDKKKIEEKNKKSEALFKEMVSALDNEIKEVRFTSKLKNHPVCISTKGNISVEMEKVMKQMPTDEKVTSEKILEINESHPIAKKLEKLYKEDKEMLSKYSKILYAQARLIEGLDVENPSEVTDMLCDIISK